MIIGVISDTHGLLREDALTALAGSEHIIHAGDVGSLEILDRLREIAPVTAVRGNIDITDALPMTATVSLGRARIFVLHKIADLRVDARDYAAIISGHSHKAEVKTERGVLFLNPGSAGPRRFRLPITLARLHATDDGMRAEIVQLRA